jgi:hypothetical protein
MTKVFLLFAVFSCSFVRTQTDQNQQLIWLNELIAITKKYEQTNSLLRYEKSIFYQDGQLSPASSTIGELRIDANDNYQLAENNQLIIQQKELNILIDSSSMEIIVSKANPIKKQFDIDLFVNTYKAGNLLLEKIKRKDEIEYVIYFFNNESIDKMIYRVNNSNDLLVNEIFLTPGNYLMENLNDETIEKPRIRFKILAYSKDAKEVKNIDLKQIFSDMDAMVLTQNYKEFSLIDLRYKNN